MVKPGFPRFSLLKVVADEGRFKSDEDSPDEVSHNRHRNPAIANPGGLSRRIANAREQIRRMIQWVTQAAVGHAARADAANS